MSVFRDLHCCQQRFGSHDVSLSNHCTCSSTAVSQCDSNFVFHNIVGGLPVYNFIFSTFQDDQNLLVMWGGGVTSNRIVVGFCAGVAKSNFIS